MSNRLARLFTRTKKKRLVFPLKIKTDDGYITIELRRECCDLEIKRVHEKGKTYYPNVKFRMGLSDVQFIHGSGVNKKTWTEVIHIPSGRVNPPHSPALTLMKLLQQMEKEDVI